LRVQHKEQIQHGAAFSIREKLSEGVVVVDPVAVQDIKRTTAFLLQALRYGLQRYLKACNVDTSSLEDDIRTVLKSQHIKIDQLRATNVAFGEKSKVGDGSADDKE
jgi:hypothetical protein